MKLKIKLLLLALLSVMTSVDCRRIVPKSYRPRVLPTQQNSCPFERDVHTTRSAIMGDIQGLLRDNIVPALQCNLGECEENPALSCDQIFSENQSSESGKYWLQTCGGEAVQAYCTMDNPCGCNSTGAWMRVALLNVSDPDTVCPHGMDPLTTNGVRACERRVQNAACVSAFFSSNYFPYNRVCGRIVGYQESSPDAFRPYFAQQSYTIDDPYVDGVSVTYGFSPRKHIWTFAAGPSNNGVNSFHCPCSMSDLEYTGVVPPFIGDDWFCEAGARDNWQRGRIYSENPLWDGQGCSTQSTCCSLHNPPWFCKELQQSTRDNIEVRMCGDQHQNDENVLVGLIELYVQ